MKVLLRRNIKKLGQIGQIVEVKTGYARNYLLPQRLAVAPTENNLKTVEAEKKAYLEELARQRSELEARAKLLEGKEFTIIARANEEGHLYGSVGPAQISQVVNREGYAIESDYVRLDEPIRKLDKYDVSVEFVEGVVAKIVLWVVPPQEDLAAAMKAAAEAPPVEKTAPEAAEPAAAEPPGDEGKGQAGP